MRWNDSSVHCLPEGHLDVAHAVKYWKESTPTVPRRRSAPLHTPAVSHLDVVRMLLGTEGIDTNRAKETGSTSCTCCRRHLDVVRMLLWMGSIRIGPTRASWPATRPRTWGTSRSSCLLVTLPGLDITMEASGAHAGGLGPQKGHTAIVRPSSESTRWPGPPPALGEARQARGARKAPCHNFKKYLKKNAE